ncbi:hypothetical protein BDV95DRAFT_496596, partial [Massariosphaeria phaeospora]
MVAPTSNTINNATRNTTRPQLGVRSNTTSNVTENTTRPQRGNRSQPVPLRGVRIGDIVSFQMLEQCQSQFPTKDASTGKFVGKGVTETVGGDPIYIERRFGVIIGKHAGGMYPGLSVLPIFSFGRRGTTFKQDVECIQYVPIMRQGQFDQFRNEHGTAMGPNRMVPLEYTTIVNENDPRVFHPSENAMIGLSHRTNLYADTRTAREGSLTPESFEMLMESVATYDSLSSRELTDRASFDTSPFDWM